MSPGSPTSAGGTFPPDASTSSSLLQRVKGGEADAWDRLARLYTPLVYTWCRSFQLSVEDTADIAQEVFRAVHSGLSTFRHDQVEHSFRAWLWTITRNRIHDHFRACGQTPEARGGSDAYRRLQEIAEPSSTLSADVQENPFDELAQRAIRLMRQDFEEPTWQAFWRTAIDDQPVADVARELGLSAAAVYQAKSRVLRRLREELGGLDGG